MTKSIHDGDRVSFSGAKGTVKKVYRANANYRRRADVEFDANGQTQKIRADYLEKINDRPAAGDPETL